MDLQVQKLPAVLTATALQQALGEDWTLGKVAAASAQWWAKCWGIIWPGAMAATLAFLVIGTTSAVVVHEDIPTQAASAAAAVAQTAKAASATTQVDTDAADVVLSAGSVAPGLAKGKATSGDVASGAASSIAPPVITGPQPAQVTSTISLVGTGIPGYHLAVFTTSGRAVGTTQVDGAGAWTLDPVSSASYGNGRGLKAVSFVAFQGPTSNRLSRASNVAGPFSVAVPDLSNYYTVQCEWTCPGDQVTGTLNLRLTPDSRVTDRSGMEILLDGSPVNWALESGQIVLKIPGIAAGNHELTARYLGNFPSADAHISFVI